MVRDVGGFRLLAWRFAWAVTVVLTTLTVCFAILWTLPETRMVGFARIEMGLSATDGASADPLRSYASWMESFLTLDWGRSIYYDRPVLALYRDRLPVTLAYLVPGIVVSVAFGTGVATYAATDREGPLHGFVSTVSVLCLSVPAFVLVWLFVTFMPTLFGWIQVYNPELGLWHPQNLLRLQVPAAVVGMSFLAVQVRHAQSETDEHLEMAFVKTARAKGAGRLRVARHVFRNAWPSMASLVLGETLGLLLLSTIVVEQVLDVPGVAVAVYNGFAAGDPMVSFTAVFGLVSVGVAGTLLRDFARLALDPRYEG